MFRTKAHHQLDMCHGSLADKILLFALPLMASSMLQLLFNAADVIVVGRFAGKESLAAVGSTTSLINLLIALFVGLSVGANVVVARNIGGQRPNIVSHAVHTAILLGSAKVLRKLQAELPFCVKLFFQAAEETTGGARQMIEAGCLQDPVVEHVIGLHVEPALETGCVQFTPGAAKAASCEFAVTIRGRSCHGAHPQDGLDPLLPACKMVLALQTIAGRRPIATDDALITVGQLHSGTKNNIIPAESCEIIDVSCMPASQQKRRHPCALSRLTTPYADCS